MMDWVKGKEVQPSVIQEDMAGLPDFDSFKENINSCSAWSGNFGGRKKRAVGEASEDTEEVPSIMDSGSGALQWVRSLVRRARSAEPGKSEGKNIAKGKGKGKKGKGKKGRKNNVGKGKKGGKGKNPNGKARKGGKGGKKGARKGGRKGGNKKSKNKKNPGNKKGKKDNKGKRGKKNRKNDKKKNDKGDKKDKKNGKNKNKEGRSGKSSDLLPDFVYNKLWCFDLAMEQALEKCVEDKLNN